MTKDEHSPNLISFQAALCREGSRSTLTQHRTATGFSETGMGFKRENHRRKQICQTPHLQNFPQSQIPGAMKVLSTWLSLRKSDHHWGSHIALPTRNHTTVGEAETLGWGRSLPPAVPCRRGAQLLLPSSQRVSWGRVQHLPRLSVLPPDLMRLKGKTRAKPEL